MKINWSSFIYNFVLFSEFSNAQLKLLISQRLKILFFSLFLVYCPLMYADEVGESIVAPLVEDDLRQAKSDIRMHERNIKVLDDLLVKIQGAQIQKTPPDTNSESSWKRSQVLVESLQPGNLDDEKYQQALALLNQSLRGAIDFSGDFWNRSNFDSIFDRDVSSEASYMKAARAAASEVISSYRKKKNSRDDGLGLIGFSDEVASWVGLAGGESLGEEELGARVLIIKKLYLKGHEAVYLSLQSEYFEAVMEGKKAAESALKALRTQERDSLRDKRKALSNFIIEFKKLEKQDEARRESTDIRLVYAVYGMIGVLLFLFLGLKVFTDDVAKALIVNRSLVEVVGMAFMLITIIILGTGEKLSKEILGTLLGTIAGYVFARGTEDGRASRKLNESSSE